MSHHWPNLTGAVVLTLIGGWFAIGSQSVPQEVAVTTAPLEESIDDLDRDASILLTFLETHCIACHAGANAAAEMNLTELASVKSSQDANRWQAVLDAVRDGVMPPEESSTQPDPGTRDEFIRAAELHLQQLEPAEASAPRLRRLTREEYENTIRDLFRLERDVFSNPTRIIQTNDYFQPQTRRMPRYVLAYGCFSHADKRHSELPGVMALPFDPPAQHGFNNQASWLSISPLMLERYFELATSLVNNPEFAQICTVWDALFRFDEKLSRPALEAEVLARLRSFLQRAFRRPVRAEDLRRYEKLFIDSFERSGSATEAMKSTVTAILVSPHFLFRHDHCKQASEAERHFAIANRLSYFLWASMPDDELVELAERRQLTDDQILCDQVTRMMRHRHVKALAINFGMQWLHLNDVHSAAPDPGLYPDFYANRQAPLSASMMIEQLLLFETILVEDRSILEFIDTDFAYLNHDLMQWYGLVPAEVLGYTPDPGIPEDFFRVKLSNAQRGGVLTAGATLVSTSTTDRSSPVFRGAWVLDVIFNDPPPPPPATVPSLDDESVVAVHHHNIRARLRAHREDPSCAACHNRMDGLGFSLEHFDPTGRYRRHYQDGTAIDASGSFNQIAFRDVDHFKMAIVRDRRRFVKAFVEHHLKYALGRRLNYRDEADIQRITEKVMADDCRYSSVIHAIVLSKLFRD